MAEIGDNNPPVVVELTKEQAEFLVHNCDTNVGYALGMLQTVSRGTAEKLVEQMEMFKGVKQAIEKGMR